VVDVGLTGGVPRHGPDVLRARFSLAADREHTVILAFGGLGLARLPYHNLRRFTDWQFVSFDHDAPDLPNLVVVRDRRYRPVDFMPLCGRLVGKPGYSSFAEACRLDVPVVTMPRQGFAEAAVLLEGIRDHAHHQILTAEEFLEGDWDFLNESPAPPRAAEPVDRNGSEAIAREIASQLAR